MRVRLPPLALLLGPFWDGPKSGALKILIRWMLERVASWHPDPVTGSVSALADMCRQT
jgi:hypothetical protein